MRPDPPEPIGIRKGCTPLHVAEVCIRCAALIDGWAFLDAHLALIDTVGFVLTGTGPVCDTCYGYTADGSVTSQ